MSDRQRVLLVVTGLTPQVVTETVYALAVASNPPWVPDRIRIVSTAEGAERARLSLLDPEVGQFHRLCRDYGLQGRICFAAEDIATIRDAGGRPLVDIRTPADNTLAADALLAEVRALCADATTELHVSIAGGRKTMGFFVGYALSLFGRKQDRLSHVLVNEPFESLRDFYFPPATGVVLHTAAGKPIHTDDARVLLADIPFVRLRDGMPRHGLNVEAPFAAMVATAQASISPPTLAFDFRTREAICSDQRVRMPPSLLAWYAWFAECRLRELGDQGFVRDCDVSPERLLEILERVAGRPDPATSHCFKDGFEPQQFQQKAAKINALLNRSLSFAAPPFRVATRGRKPNTRYGIALEPSAIEALGEGARSTESRREIARA